MNTLSCMYPDVASAIIKYIPQYGRFDDLLVCLGTPVEKDLIEIDGVNFEDIDLSILLNCFYKKSYLLK